MDRVWIRGTSGSGKTTLAYDLQERLGIPAIDLDDLYWLPGWSNRSREEFGSLVGEVVARPVWIVSGNYSKVAPLIESAADTMVWLDYSFAITFGRILRRTFRRVFRGERCCNGNREELIKSFFSRESVIWWMITTHRRRRLEALACLAEAPQLGQIRLRHRTPKETQDWLRTL